MDWRTMLESIITIYLIVAAIAFIGFFISCFDMIYDTAKFGKEGRTYDIYDHLIVCLGVGFTWPLSIFILFVRGADNGQNKKD